MDDELKQLEQFVLGDSSSSSCGSCSPVDTMSCPSPQTSPQATSQCSSIYQDHLRDLSTTQSFPCSSDETLPPISHLSPSSTFQHVYHANHEILAPKHGQSFLSIDNHITSNNMFDLNGNIHETHGAVMHYTDYHEPDFGGHYYQTPHIAQDQCNYSNGAHTDNFVCSVPASCHDTQMYQWCGTPNDYDSEDSFEVESDNVFPGQRTSHFGPNSRAQHQNLTCQDVNPLPNFSVFSAELKKVPNRRGRPVTYNKPGYHYSDSDGIPSDEDDRSGQSKGCRRGAKNILLWKFLLGELRKPNSNHIKWENEREGIFKFVDTAECSRLWGQMKKKEDMNFEKLSRGIRHYYKDGLMSRRDGIRLVYKFNWDRVPRAFWPRGR